MRIALALLILLGSLSISASDFDETKALAERGFAVAQFNLASMYYKGEGTPQDYKEALRWYRASAEQGNAHAQNNLGNMYDEGKGTPLDDKEAVMESMEFELDNSSTKFMECSA